MMVEGEFCMTDPKKYNNRKLIEISPKANKYIYVLLRVRV